MALPSSSSSDAPAAATESVVLEPQAQAIKKKRATDPGVRTKGNRTYDSANGTTCHQCRQKTMDFAAKCKNWKVDKQCTIKFCHKCLHNRYGEKAEEVAVLSDWNCPKCRGICNCSCCMKKRGQKPTGILVHTAKKSGFSSVSEMLNIDDVFGINGAKSTKNLDSDKGPVVISPIKKGKENTCDIDNFTLNSQKISQNGLKKKSIGDKELDPNSRKEGVKRPKISKEGLAKVVKQKCDGMDEINGDVSMEKGNTKVFKDAILELDLSEGVDQSKDSNDGESLQGSEVLDALDHDDVGAKLKQNGGRLKMATEMIQHEEVKPDIILPQGTDLKAVAGIELPSELIGQALQFLEFCAAFGEALQLRKGRAESVLREVVQGQERRRCQYSSTVQFHLQLLALIQEDLGEESPSLSPSDGEISWLEAFEKCISESPVPMDSLPESFEGYANLGRSEKLKLLNILCDEALGTAYFRDLIDDRNSKYAEKQKKSKENVSAAKNKEKQLKQKLHDEVATAIIAKKAPLSESEHEAIVAQLKDELAQVHTEVLEAMDTVPSKKERYATVRTEPMLLDDNGCVFWKLRCCPDAPDLLLQVLGTWDACASKEEKWISYDPEQKPQVEKYISSKKLNNSLNHSKKRKQRQEVAVADPVQVGETVMSN